MLAFLTPGQGSQTPGLFNTWVKENSEISASLKEQLTATLTELDSLIEQDLLHLGDSASDEEIKLTQNAQPLLFAAGLMGALEIFGSVKFSDRLLPDLLSNSAEVIFAGHSVGEVLALYLSGKISLAGAMKLVAKRGELMGIAASKSTTGMSAVLGGARDEVIAKLTSFGLTAANENGGGQIVAAGQLPDLEKLLQDPPAGARVRPLAVAGAFHTSAMQSAQDWFKANSGEFAKELKENESKIITNKDGSLITSASEYLNLLIGQIASPVRWDLSMDQLIASGVSGVLELPPAGVLSGLVKRHAPEIEIFTLKSPADLPAAREFIAQHAPQLGALIER